MPKRFASQFRGRRVRARTSGSFSRIRTPGRKRLASAPRSGLRKRMRTMTRTKLHQRARALPNRSGSESVLNIYNRPKGLIAKVGNKLQSSQYLRNENAVMNSSAGAQLVNSFTEMFSVNDLKKLLTDAENENVTTAVANATTKIFVKSCYCELQIQNSTNAVCRVQIWNTLPKRDIYRDSASQPLSPQEAQAIGVKMQTPSGTGTEYLIVGSRPTDSKLFNDYFKVKKVTYIDLAPGQVHYHRMHYKIDRFASQEMLNMQNITAMRGWNLASMIIAYGEPMVDNTGVATTTSATQLHVIATKTYHYSYVKSNSTYSSNSNNLSAVSGTNLENLVTGASAAFAAVT